MMDSALAVHLSWRSRNIGTNRKALRQRKGREMFEKLLRVRSRLRQGRFGTSAQDVFYSDAVVVGNAFIIKARGSHNGAHMGRVVAEALIPTACCYVFDIVVEPPYRGQGIAFQLLKRALQHSACATLVPVGIQQPAIAFWAHLATNRKLPVRLGLEGKEVEALRYAHKSEGNAHTIGC